MNACRTAEKRLFCLVLEHAPRASYFFLHVLFLDCPLKKVAGGLRGGRRGAGGAGAHSSKRVTHDGRKKAHNEEIIVVFESKDTSRAALLSHLLSVRLSSGHNKKILLHSRDCDVGCP